MILCSRSFLPKFLGVKDLLPHRTLQFSRSKSFSQLISFDVLMSQNSHYQDLCHGTQFTLMDTMGIYFLSCIIIIFINIF